MPHQFVRALIIFGMCIWDVPYVTGGKDFNGLSSDEHLKETNIFGWKTISIAKLYNSSLVKMLLTQ